MIKFFRLLYQPYKWLFFLPFLALSTLFFGLLTVLLVYIINPKTASMICGTAWARLNAFMTPMLIKISGRDNISRQQSYVIVSNHQSQYDIFVLYGWLGVDFKWVMKQELRKVPFIGIACERIGHIFINRSDRASAFAALNAAKKKIVNGTSIVFFPEGTRSSDGSLGLFKKGAFKMAIDLRLPILPITISGTKNILPSNSMDLFPGRAHMKIHKSIDIAGFSDNNMQELIDKTHSVIESGLQ